MIEADRGSRTGGREPQTWNRFGLALASVLLGAAVAGLVIIGLEAVLLLAVVILVLGCGLAILYRPFWGLLAVIWLVPMHSLVLAGLVSVGSVPQPALEAFKLWKVALVVVLLLGILWSRRSSFRMTWLDACIGLFFLLELLYLFLPSQIPGWEVKLFGLQTDSVFFLFYVLGRLYPYSYRQFRLVVTSVLALGWIAAVFALLEAVVFRGWLFKLGSYFSYLGKDISQNLPHQFYSFIGGVFVLRPGSIYLNPIELSFALLIPLGLTWGLGLHNAYRPARRLWIGLFIMLGALLLALSRSALVGLAIGLLFVVLLRPRMPRWFLVAGAMLLVGALVLGAVVGLDRFLSETVNLADPSAQGHLARWRLSVEAIRQSPFGLGLGSTGPVARRFIGKEALVNESWYFQIATEMGIITGVVFGLIVVLLIVQAVRIWKAVPGRLLRGAALGFVAAAVALAIASLFLHTWAYDAAAFPFWLWAGLIIQLPERLRRPGWLPRDRHDRGLADAEPV